MIIWKSQTKHESFNFRIRQNISIILNDVKFLFTINNKASRGELSNYNKQKSKNKPKD